MPPRFRTRGVTRRRYTPPTTSTRPTGKAPPYYNPWRQPTTTPAESTAKIAPKTFPGKGGQAMQTPEQAARDVLTTVHGISHQVVDYLGNVQINPQGLNTSFTQSGQPIMPWTIPNAAAGSSYAKPMPYRNPYLNNPVINYEHNANPGTQWYMNGQYYEAQPLSSYYVAQGGKGFQGTGAMRLKLPPGAVVQNNTVYVPMSPATTAHNVGTKTDSLGNPLYLRKFPKVQVHPPKATEMPGVLKPPIGELDRQAPYDAYAGGGGGGYAPYPYYPPTTTSYSSPFNQYQRGGAIRGTEAMQAPTVGTSGEPQRYRNTAPTVYPARWQQLLTNWRI